MIDRCLAAGVAAGAAVDPLLHGELEGDPRPWHVGVLWDRDARLAQPLLDALYAEGDLIVGDNEPYTGQLEGDCMWRHATSAGLPMRSIEIRQDLIRDAAGQEAWARAPLPYCRGRS